MYDFWASGSISLFTLQRYKQHKEDLSSTLPTCAGLYKIHNIQFLTWPTITFQFQHITHYVDFWKVEKQNDSDKILDMSPFGADFALFLDK